MRIKRLAAGLAITVSSSVFLTTGCGRAATSSNVIGALQSGVEESGDDALSADSQSGVTVIDSQNKSHESCLLTGFSGAYYSDGAGNLTQLFFTDEKVADFEKILETDHGFFAAYSVYKDETAGTVERRVTLLKDDGKRVDFPLSDLVWTIDLALYNGEVYLTENPYSDNYAVYKFNPDTETMDPSSDFDELFSQLYGSYDFASNGGVISALSDHGWIYITDTNTGCSYLTDADTLILMEIPEIENTGRHYLAGSEDYLVIQDIEYTDNYLDCFYCYSMLGVYDDSSAVLYDGDDYFQVLAMDGSKCYYCIFSTEDNEYLIEYQFYVYDISSDEKTLLYTTSTIPGDSTGAWVSTPGLTGFTLCGDYIYTLMTDGDEIAWHTLSLADGCATVTRLPIEADRKLSFAEHGTVEYDYTRYETDSGDMYYYYYVELLQLKDSYPNSDIINADLREIFEGEIAVCTGDVEYYSEYAEDYALYPPYITFVYSNTELLSEKYISVEYAQYNYGGGAHGMDFYPRYVYDLTTGERVEFKDLYKGTKTQFKKIVADYTSKFHEENNDLFFEDYSEAVWDTYYVGANLEMNGYLTSDSYVISYMPYEYGPFASGYIDVPIPLEEFGITY